MPDWSCTFEGCPACGGASATVEAYIATVPITANTGQVLDPEAVRTRFRCKRCEYRWDVELRPTGRSRDEPTG